jgi:hypothetical protein
MKKDIKIIARFMGYKVENKKFQTLRYHSSNESEWEWEEGEIVTLNGDEVSDENNEPYFSLERLPFKSDWNWLMTVIEKIESIKDNHHGYFAVCVSSNTCSIQATNFRPDKPIPNPPHYYNSFTCNSKIESTYNAVVEFIKFYNTKKQE